MIRRLRLLLLRRDLRWVEERIARSDEIDRMLVGPILQQERHRLTREIRQVQAGR